MQPNDDFKKMINTVAPLLKLKGYSRKGNAFYKQQGGNWGLVSSQKSQKNTAFQIVFTINLGICSKLLMEFRSDSAANKPPTIEKCHWSRRIGGLLPIHSDKWWSINTETSIDSFCHEIETSLQVTIGEIDKYISDEQLLSLWLSSASPGITVLQRLMYLSVFLKSVGNDKLLKITLQQLQKMSEGKSSAFVVKQHRSHL
jgi:hypothetical protein